MVMFVHKTIRQPACRDLHREVDELRARGQKVPKVFNWIIEKCKVYKSTRRHSKKSMTRRVTLKRRSVKRKRAVKSARRGRRRPL